MSQPVRTKVEFSKLLDIYLNGFGSGIASAARTIGAPEEAADAMAQQMVETLKANPSAIEAVRAEIRDVLLGTDSGPRDIELNTTKGN